jgi:Flp pilus assembly protein TadG
MNNRPCTTGQGLRLARGSVTAETAVILPALVIILFAFLWGIGVAVAQMQCVDAARAAARAVARGERLADARTAASQAAPTGAEISMATGDDSVKATVIARLRGPGPLLSRFALTVQGSATAMAEVPR